MCRVSKFIIIAVLLIFCSCIFSGMALAEKGMPAPDFSLKTTSGETVRLSDYRGKEEVILIFWEYRCKICKNDLKSLGTKSDDLKKNHNIELLGVNIGNSENTVTTFLTRYKISLKNIMDEDGDVAYDYDISGVPAYVWVDKEGRIKYEGHWFPDVKKVY